MKKFAAGLCFVLLLAMVSGVTAQTAIPSLAMTAEWPEQKLENDLIHKTRPPRGGSFDIVVRLDPAGVKYRKWEKPRVIISSEPELQAVKAMVDGTQREEPDMKITFDKLEEPVEIRWTFQIPWELDKAIPECTFKITYDLPYRYADLRKSLTIEPGISCYDTTFTDRMRLLSKSDFCRFETIGKSAAGREMHFMRITNTRISNQDKKKFLMIGAYHGVESSGHGSILDFVHELITDPAKSRYLDKCALYIVPCMSPDSREMALYDHPNGINMNDTFKDGKIQHVETEHVTNVLLKYKSELSGALSMTTHQWGRKYLLLSHDPKAEGDWSAKLMKNVGIRVSNETGQYIHVNTPVPKPGPMRQIRGWMYQKLDLPTFVLENAGAGRYNLARTKEDMQLESRIYWAILDQLIKPAPVKPKAHPTVKMEFPPEKNYQVYKASRAPVIDGKLDEACWRHPSIITNFKTIDKKREQKGNTTVHIVYDDENLYIAYQVPDLQAGTFTDEASAGSMWKEDGADFLLDTNLNRWSYFQFLANSNGVLVKTYWPIAGIRDSHTFKPQGCEASGSVENGAIEIKIPFAAFNGHPEMVDQAVGAPPKPGTVWGANFLRNVPSTSWSPLSGSAHAPWEVNAITFTGKTR